MARPLAPSPPRSLALFAAMTLVFLALRVPLLIVREPFFDELVTKWIAHKPVSEHWAALAHDSGMPLYYAIARLVHRVAGFDVRSGRILSLIFGFGALVVCFFATDAGTRGRGDAGSELRVSASPRLRVLIAAAIITVFPPHIFFSTEARAYALSALFVGIAAVSLYRWSATGSSSQLALAAASLLLSAYSHPYGVLLFPLPFLIGLDKRRRGWIMPGAIATGVVAVLFIPGFWLARLQPSEAIGWMRGGGVSGLGGTPFLQLGFAAPYPPILFMPPPLPLQLLSLACVLTIVVAGVMTSAEARFFAMLVLVPVVGVFAFGAAGALVYFPVRFESVLAVPFALLIATSVAATRPRWTFAIAGVALLLGVAVGVHAILDHRHRPPDQYREVATLVRDRVDEQTVVASGYAYLEVMNQIGEERVIAFPREQALHPGWRRVPSREQLVNEVALLPPRFVWVGPVQSEEWTAISQHYRVQLLEARGFIVAALAERGSAAVSAAGPRPSRPRARDARAPAGGTPALRRESP